MNWVVAHWFALVLFALYAAVLVIHARTGFHRSRNIAGFLVGNRNLGGFVIGASFFATFASTNSYIGLAGQGYDYGIPWLIFPVLMLLFTWLSWRYVAPGLRRFTVISDAVTVPEFIAVRFSSNIARTSAGFVILFASVLYLVAIFKGAGNLFQVFLDIDYTAAVGVMLLVVLVYTAVGGFISVVRTDVLQGALMLIGSVVLFYFVTRASGGVDTIVDLAHDANTEWLFTWNAGTPFVVLLGITLAGSMKLLIDPRQVSRFYGLRDEKSTKQGVIVALVGLLVIQFCLFPLGIYAHNLITDVEDTDLIIPMIINDAQLIPSLVADFLIVAIVSAAMSSMDSVLLVAGSVISRDIVGSYVKLNDSQHVVWSRFCIIGTAVVAALIALNPPTGIVGLTILSGSLYAICFVPTLILGLHWQRGNSQAAMSAFVIGILVLIVWRTTGLSNHIHEVFPSLLSSTLAYVIAALLYPTKTNRYVQEYFDGKSGEIAT